MMPPTPPPTPHPSPQRALVAASHSLTAHFIQLLSLLPKTPEVIAAPTRRYLTTRSLVERALVGLFGIHPQPARLRWTPSAVFVGDLDTTRVLRDRPHLLTLYRLLAQSPLAGLRFDAPPTPLMLDVLAQHLAPFIGPRPPHALPALDLPRVALLRRDASPAAALHAAPSPTLTPPTLAAATAEAAANDDAPPHPALSPPLPSDAPSDPRPDAARLLAAVKAAVEASPSDPPAHHHHQRVWTLLLRGAVACAQRALRAPDGLIACLTLTPTLSSAQTPDAIAARAALAALVCAAPLRPSREDLLALGVAALLGPIALDHARRPGAPSPLRCALAWLARERLALSSSQLRAATLLAEALDALGQPRPDDAPPHPPHIDLLLNAWRFAAAPAPRSGEPVAAYTQGWAEVLDGAVAPSPLGATFLRALILYPPGTLLTLNDGRRGVVSASTAPKRLIAVVRPSPGAAPALTLNLARLRNVRSVDAPTPARAAEAWDALLRAWGGRRL